jgi:catechol 2,3-dioxygenase-like lactoylglutathione lyase family enzyme
MFKAIDHVQLAAPKGSEDQAREFFGKVLGFQELAKPDSLKKRGGVWFSYGDVQIHIGIEEPFSPARKAHPAFEVENIKKLKERFVHFDIAYTVDDNLPGANRIYFNDPFGNRLEVLEWLN